MKKYKFSKYFENEVLRKRPYIKKEWCIKVIENPIKVEKQEENRWRFWGIVPKSLFVLQETPQVCYNKAILKKYLSPKR